MISSICFLKTVYFTVGITLRVIQKVQMRKQWEDALSSSFLVTRLTCPLATSVIS